MILLMVRVNEPLGSRPVAVDGRHTRILEMGRELGFSKAGSVKSCGVCIYRAC